MFEPSVLFIVLLNMLMLPTVMPISKPTTNLLVLSLVGVLVMNSPEPLSLQGGYGGCTIRFFVRVVVHLLLVGGSVFLDPLCGISV